MLLCQVDDPAAPMLQLTIQSVGAIPNSLLLAELNGQMQLLCGLQNGVLIRSVVDTSNNALTDATKRFLGSRPVGLFRVVCETIQCVICISSRSWLCYSAPGPGAQTVSLVPLAYEPLEYAAPFQSDQCTDGIVAIAGSTLRIVAVEKLGVPFSSSVVHLTHTPRRMISHPVHPNLAVVIETDHRRPLVDRVSWSLMFVVPCGINPLCVGHG